MKIGFVIYQSGARANGGVESVTRLIEGLAASHERTVIAGLQDTNAAERWRRSGATVEAMPGGHFNRWRAVGRWLARERPSVVHCNDVRSMVDALPAAWWLGLPIIFNVRDTLEPGARYGLKWRVARMAASRVVTLSAGMESDVARRLKPLWGRGAPVSHVYSIATATADGRGREECRASLGIHEKTVAVGIVANVVAKKNQLGFLRRAAGEILRSCPAATIFFVGDFDPDANTYCRECLRVAEQQSFGKRVKFTGFDPDVTQWYRALDALVLASRREGLARCMIEGLVCGKPMVSFDVCSAREILEGSAEKPKGETHWSEQVNTGAGKRKAHDKEQSTAVGAKSTEMLKADTLQVEGDTRGSLQPVGDACGIVVRQGDYAGLADAVVRLAGDPELRESMGQNGRRLAERLFDPERSVAEYERIYREVVAERLGGIGR